MGAAVAPAPGPTTITPTTAGLGVVQLGGTASQTFVVSNLSTTTDSVSTGYTLSGSSEFTDAGTGTCAASGFTLTPSSTCTIIIDYTAADGSAQPLRAQSRSI